jgi:2-polyprenyl-6-methoxyphenol hydroxylase-like FAD-dependent oxidoreductase
MSGTAPPSASPPSHTRRFDVVVRGAGVVGQVLALLLARERLRVALVAPQAPERGNDVRAYALNAASRELLLALRAWPDQTPGAVTPVTAMQVWGDGGGQLRFDATELGAEALTWIVDVPALERRLTDAIGFQGGIERLAEAPPAGLTVICEGRRSATRDALGIAFDVRPYPHMALAARLRTEHPHGGVARQWFVDGEVMALLPLDGPAGNLVALVWSLPTQQAMAWLQAEPSQLAQAVQARSAQALGTLHMDASAQAWPLELARARSWIARGASGAVALAGDAAHAVHPLAGQGLNLGLADAAELARVLHAREYWREPGDPRLLRRYERARAADVQAMAFVTDGLFGLFGLTDTRAQMLRNRGLSGVDRSSPLKRWLARQAMGLSL